MVIIGAMVSGLWAPFKREQGGSYRSQYATEWLKFARVKLRTGSGDRLMRRSRRTLLGSVLLTLSPWSVGLDDKEYGLVMAALRAGQKNVHLGNIILSWVWAFVLDELILKGREVLVPTQLSKFYPPVIRPSEGGGLELWSCPKNAITTEDYTGKLVQLGVDPMLFWRAVVGREDKLFWYNTYMGDHSALRGMLMVVEVGARLWRLWGSKYWYIRRLVGDRKVFDFPWIGELTWDEILWMGRLWLQGGYFGRVKLEVVTKTRRTIVSRYAALGALEDMVVQCRFLRRAWAMEMMEKIIGQKFKQEGEVGMVLRHLRERLIWRSVYQGILVPVIENYSHVAPWEIGSGAWRNMMKGVNCKRVVRRMAWEMQLPRPSTLRRGSYWVDMWFAPVYWLRFVLGDLPLQQVPLPLWPLYLRYVDRDKLPVEVAPYQTVQDGSPSEMAKRVMEEITPYVAELATSIANAIKTPLPIDKRINPVGFRARPSKIEDIGV